MAFAAFVADNPPEHHIADYHTVAPAAAVGTPAVPVAHHTVPAAARTEAVVHTEAADHTVPEVPVGRMEAVLPEAGMEAAVRTALEEHRIALVGERRIGLVPGVRRMAVVRLGEGRRTGPGEHRIGPVARLRKVAVHQRVCWISHPWCRSSNRWRQAGACTATSQGLSPPVG